MSQPSKTYARISLSQILFIHLPLVLKYSSDRAVPKLSQLVNPLGGNVQIQTGPVGLSVCIPSSLPREVLFRSTLEK